MKYFFSALVVFFSTSSALACAANYDSNITGHSHSSLASEDFWIEFASSAIYALFGILMAVIAFKIVDFLTPGHLGKQIGEDKNIAIAVVVGFFVLGVSVIIAAAISG